jgi:hypothetical protein
MDLTVDCLVFVFTSHRIYSPQLEISLEEAKSLWLPVMFTDEDSKFLDLHTQNNRF